MKIDVPANELAEALRWATKTLRQVGDKPPVVVLETDTEGTAVLYYLDQDSYMRTPLTISNAYGEIGAHQLTLNGSFLKNLIPAIDGGDGSATLELAQSTSGVSHLSVTTSRGKFKAPLTSDTGKVSAKPTPTVIGEVDEFDYLSRLGEVSNICASPKDSLSPVGTAVDFYLDTDNDQAVFYANSGYSLGEVKIPFTVDSELDEATQSRHFLIPGSSARLVGTSNKRAGEPLVILFDKTNERFGYRFTDGREVLFALVNAEPIPYQDSKDRFVEAADSSITVRKDSFTSSIGIMSHLSENNAVIYWNIKDDSMLMTDSFESNTLKVDTEEVVTEEDDVRMAANRAITLNALHIAREPFLRISWDSESEGSPYIFESVDENGEVNPSTFGIFARMEA